MAMQQRKRRRRSGGNNNNNVNPNKHFESNGPEVRIRGSAAQILEKYQQYARDAATSGDRVKAEALYQHAEHYARIVAEINKEQEKVRAEREAREAAKAEERAARDAEQRAEREARQQDSATAEDEAATPENTSEAAPEPADTEAEATADADEKPKRGRRRTYARKKPEAEEDGVMKTLARGADADAEAE